MEQDTERLEIARSINKLTFSQADSLFCVSFCFGLLLEPSVHQLENEDSLAGLTPDTTCNAYTGSCRKQCLARLVDGASAASSFHCKAVRFPNGTSIRQIAEDSGREINGTWIIS